MKHTANRTLLLNNFLRDAEEHFLCHVYHLIFIHIILNIIYIYSILFLLTIRLLSLYRSFLSFRFRVEFILIIVFLFFFFSPLSRYFIAFLILLLMQVSLFLVENFVSEAISNVVIVTIIIGIDRDLLIRVVLIIIILILILINFVAQLQGIVACSGVFSLQLVARFKLL